MLEIPDEVANKDYNYVFIPYDYWVGDYWDEIEKKQYPYTLHSKQGKVHVKRGFKSVEIEKKLKKIEAINKYSDEISWEKVARMLYNICIATYGEEFQNTLEGQAFKRLGELG